MNYEHPFPRVSGYQRVYDIMEVDITEFRVYLQESLGTDISNGHNNYSNVVPQM